ncbi:cryptochrome/photolyase family protein [Caenimonas terrae]|uniref:Cryptochrome/photolyase family protein n=1 Tax=Caenimonas terrae TaxID=696074 RepID=A0ABW0NAU2_9BURK
MEKTYPAGLMWFRRDLRTTDNAALFHALKSCRQLHCAFVFDRAILDGLPRRDRRVEFIRESLVELDAALRQLARADGAGLIVAHAAALQDIPRLARELQVQSVFANHDYEPQAMARDAHVRGELADAGIAFHTFKDQAIFERHELLTQSGKPYAVFTPYKNAWLAKADAFYFKPYPVPAYADALAARPPALRAEVPSLPALGFEPTNLAELKLPTGASGARELLAEFLERIDRYADTRDYPAVKGPSYLGVHLRFGTASIRELAGTAHRLAAAGSAGAAVWLSELIWRDFYFQVLANFPHVADEQGRSHSFKRDYDAIKWDHGKQADALFAAWCEGRTGYPLVDAAMAQINQSGYMHNRLRMVVASFLTKDLGLDWRRGERYFAEHLNDYELASNNGGWQWASSTGCDAQPWFRIFNPVSQSRKFDPEGRFILKYLPQLAGLPVDVLHAPWTANPVELAAAGVTLDQTYPAPIVAHDEARERTLQRYSVVKKNAA